MDKNIPTEPGFYWAKSRSYKWYNCIIQISGESPYLEWTVWDRANDKLLMGKGVPSEFTFGLRINEPESGVR